MLDKDWVEILGGIERTLIEQASRVNEKDNGAVVEKRQQAIRAELEASAILPFDPDLSDDEFWRRTALKPFYAGTVAATVDRYAAHSMTYLDDWRQLGDAAWRPHGKKGRGGSRFEAFLADPGCFQNRPRLTKAIKAARGLLTMKRNFPDQTFMQHFLTASRYDGSIAAQRRLYKNLRDHLAMSEVATYHLMMELGLPIIKPDRVVNRVAIRLEMIRWQDGMGRRLSPRSPANEMDTLGRNEDFSWTFQQIVQQIAQDTGISVKKIDNLLVKMGQNADPDKGIYARTVCRSVNPRCNLCLASAACAFPT